jgi:hypothetical protein
MGLPFDCLPLPFVDLGTLFLFTEEKVRRSIAGRIVG